MYETYYGFNEKPFALNPDPDFFYSSKRHKTAFAMLEYGLTTQMGFTVVTGEVGSGKTTLVRRILKQIPGMDDQITVGLITNTHKSFGNLLEWILLAFDLPYKDMSKVELYQTFIDFVIEEYAQNRRVVLFIDEAQNMDVDTLEELRLLSNVNADKDLIMQLILVGQPELLEKLKRPDLRQFAQRISVDYHLMPLSFKETQGYIRHRLVVAEGDPNLFDAMACGAIYYHSGGVPRLINTLCDTALVYGFAEDKTLIDIEVIFSVVADKKLGGLMPLSDRPEGLSREEIYEQIAEMCGE